MVCFKYFLTFLLGICFSIFVSSVSFNVPNNYIEEVNIIAANSVDLQRSVKFEDTLRSLSQTHSGCDCGPYTRMCTLYDGTNMCACANGDLLYANNNKKCPSPECDCGPNSRWCKLDKGFKKCTCVDGSQPVIGINGLCPTTKCDCGQHSKLCEFYQGGRKCTCLDDTVLVTNRMDIMCPPPKCDCGLYARVCLYNENKKVCYCRANVIMTGFVDDTCEPLGCHCGPSTVFCQEFRDSVVDKKNCTCADGSTVITAIDDDQLTCPAKQCDCGVNSISCSFDYYKKKRCTCKAGFAPKFFIHNEEICTKCDCGQGEISCSYSPEGRRICFCGEEFLVDYEGRSRDQICKRNCYCGEDAISCSYNSKGLRVCNCGEDSLLEYEGLSRDQTCKKIEKSPYTSVPWIIGYVFLSVGVIVIIVVIVVVILKRRRYAAHKANTTGIRMSNK